MTINKEITAKAIAKVKAIATAPAEPVEVPVHFPESAKPWFDTSTLSYHCSNCNSAVSIRRRIFNYCPECGFKIIMPEKNLIPEVPHLCNMTLKEIHDYCGYIQKNYNRDCEHCDFYKECIASNFDDPYLWKIGGME